MKNLFLSVAAVVICTAGVQAQQHPGMQAAKKHLPMHHIKQVKAKAAHIVRLNEEQKKQAQAINKSYQAKVEKLRSNDKITMGEYKKQLAGLQKDRKAQMQALLTTEQKNRIAAAQKRRAENRQVQAAAHLERMKIRLELKDEQVSKIKNLQTQLASKAKAIKENDALTLEDKKYKMKELAKERKEAFAAILTPEQKEKMQQKNKHTTESK